MSKAGKCHHRWWWPWVGSLISRLCDRCGRVEWFVGQRWRHHGEYTQERPREAAKEAT